MDQGRGRIDIIADNYGQAGLFAELRQELNTTSVPIECKNYNDDLGNEEFNQLNDRLGEKLALRNPFLPVGHRQTGHGQTPDRPVASP